MKINSKGNKLTVTYLDTRSPLICGKKSSKKDCVEVEVNVVKPSKPWIYSEPISESPIESNQVVDIINSSSEPTKPPRSSTEVVKPPRSSAEQEKPPKSSVKQRKPPKSQSISPSNSSTSIRPPKSSILPNLDKTITDSLAKIGVPLDCEKNDEVCIFLNNLFRLSNPRIPNPADSKSSASER